MRLVTTGIRHEMKSDLEVTSMYVRSQSVNEIHLQMV